MLVKPQFELQPGASARAASCKTPALYAVVEKRLREACAALGLRGARLVRQRHRRAATATASSFSMPCAPQRRRPMTRRSHARSRELRVLSAEDAGRRGKLRAVRQQLVALEARVLRVTYGAGGSTHDKTLRHRARHPAPKACDAAPHLSCVGSTRDSIAEKLAQLQAQGVRRLVALRGDLPSGTATGRRVPLRERPDRLHPRGDRARLPHRGRRLPRVPPAGALRRSATCRPSRPR